MHYPDVQNDPVISFCHEWLSEKSIFKLTTSGSTGTPKEISISRNAMLSSALKTIAFFNLKKGDKSLLCLNTAFIGGKMMLVRAMEAEMEMYVTPPSSMPLTSDLPAQDFAAFVPLQLHDILSINKFDEFLNRMKGIIVGGAAISEKLEELCRRLSCPVYSTYGMTETVSHVALKRINSNNPDSCYTTLPGILIGQTKEGCLEISGDVTENRLVKTNDVVRLINKNQFEWLGRKDNIINTGGVKVQIELLERKIEPILKGLNIYFNFIIASMPDDKLGERIVMVAESNVTDESKIMEMLKSNLDKYEIPRKIIFCAPFSYTTSGKIDRIATIRSIKR